MNEASMLDVLSSFIGGYERVRSYVSPPSWSSRKKRLLGVFERRILADECRDEGGEEATTYEPGHPDHDRA